MTGQVLVLMLAGSVAAVPAAETVEAGDVPVLRVVYPDKPWSLVADLDGFDIGESHLNTRGDTVSLKGYDPESELLLSVRLAPAASEGGAIACRDQYWKTLRERTPGVRGDFSELGDLALVEYAAAAVEGVGADQRQVHGCLAHDGVWIEIHLSAAVFRPGDQVTVRRTLRRFRVVPDGGAR